MTWDVFVSYNSADRAIAAEIAERLVGAGLRVWFDTARLNPGCDWHREFEEGCEASRIVAPVLTPRWSESIWTQFETFGAESIIPVLVEGELANTVPPPLQRYQVVDLRFGWDGWE